MCQANFTLPESIHELSMPPETDWQHVLQENPSPSESLGSVLARLDRQIMMAAAWLHDETSCDCATLLAVLNASVTALELHPNADALGQQRLPWQLRALLGELAGLARLRSGLKKGVLPSIEAELVKLEMMLMVPPHPGGHEPDTLPDRLDHVCFALSQNPRLASLCDRLAEQAGALRDMQKAERQLRCGALMPFQQLLIQIRRQNPYDDEQA